MSVAQRASRALSSGSGWFTPSRCRKTSAMPGTPASARRTKSAIRISSGTASIACWMTSSRPSTAALGSFS